MRIKYITMDPKMPFWSSLPRKLAKIQRILNTMKNADFALPEVEHRKLKPEVVDGRVTHDFMDSISTPLHKEGYQFVALHFSKQNKRDLGIQPNLNGMYQADYDPVSEIYLMCDETSKRGRFNMFEQTSVHEVGHDVCRNTGVYDFIHDVHAQDVDITPFMARLDINNYNPNRRNMLKQISLLKEVVSLLEKMKLMQRSTIYQECLKRIDTDASPLDRAPDTVGCAETASEIINGVLHNFPIYTGTYSLWEALKADRRFREVTIPMPGTIIISPTGTAPTAIPGHVGFFADGENIISNTSKTGLLQKNYTLTGWKARWGKAGYPVLFYQLNS